MEEKEEWRPVVGYEGYYEVSSLGRVRGLDRIVKHSRGGNRIIKGRQLIPINVNGYRNVMIRKNGIGNKLLIHRLVAIAFLGMMDKSFEINHKNCIKSDNRVSNLEWCTRQENMKHAINTGRLQHNFNEDDVLKIKRMLKNTSMSKISRMFNVSLSSICSIANNKTYKYVGDKVNETFYQKGKLKLNSRIIQDILEMAKSGYTQKSIAQKYNTDQSLIGRVLKTKTTFRYKSDWRRKINHENIIEIKKLHCNGMMQVAIAEKFNVSKSLICQIINDKRTYMSLPSESVHVS